MRDYNPDGTIPVPASDAPLYEIWEFALTYNGYSRYGGTAVIGQMANRLEADFARTSELPEDVDVLRAALFFEQRRAHHFGEFGPRELSEYLRALLDKIRDLSRGSVSGPGDPYP